jgi:hypothetical protein
MVILNSALLNSRTLSSGFLSFGSSDLWADNLFGTNDGGGLSHTSTRFPMVESKFCARYCCGYGSICSQRESRRSLQVIGGQIGGSRGVARQPLKLLGRQATPVSGISPRSNDI